MNLDRVPYIAGRPDDAPLWVAAFSASYLPIVLGALEDWKAARLFEPVGDLALQAEMVQKVNDLQAQITQAYEAQMIPSISILKEPQQASTLSDGWNARDLVADYNVGAMLSVNANGEFAFNSDGKYLIEGLVPGWRSNRIASRIVKVSSGVVIAQGSWAYTNGGQANATALSLISSVVEIRGFDYYRLESYVQTESNARTSVTEALAVSGDFEAVLRVWGLGE